MANPPLRVLVVDDSEDDALMLLREIRLGYEPVFTQVWTPEAMHAALATPWDIVISDWSMPNFDGRDVHLSALKQRMIAALCKLCHDVDCKVVGEGIETIDERECLVGLGCDLLQGSFLGRPSRELPADPS